MKKLSLAVSALLLTAGLFAQDPTAAPQEAVNPMASPNYSVVKTQQSYTGNETESRDGHFKKDFQDTADVRGWVYQSNALQGVGTVEGYYSELFPDSSVSVIYGNQDEPSYINRHSIGNVLDMKTDIMRNLITTDVNGNALDGQFTRWTDYSLDSVEFSFLYRRGEDTNFVDTIFIQYITDVYNNNGTVNRNILLLGTTENNEFTLTPGYATLNYDQGEHNRVPLGAGVSEDTLLLTVADTGVRTFRGAVRDGNSLLINPSITNGRSGEDENNGLCAFTITFRPGYSYEFGDTLYSFQEDKISSKGNRSFFRPLMFREALNIPHESYNYSVIALSESKYGTFDPPTGGGTNYFNGGVYYVGIGFGNGSQTIPQYLNGGFHISTYTYILSTEDVENGVKPITTYPNPLSVGEDLNVPVELSQARNISFTITDVTGRTIATRGEQTYPAGRQILTFNTAAFKPGTYFLQMNVNGAVQTSKFIVR